MQGLTDLVPAINIFNIVMFLEKDVRFILGDVEFDVFVRLKVDKTQKNGGCLKFKIDVQDGNKGRQII